MKKLFILLAGASCWLAASAGAEAQDASAPWWNAFGDALLDSLVEKGLEVNYDVAAAVNSVNMARAAVGSASAAYYPTVGIDAGWQRTGISGVAAAGEHSPASSTSAFSAAASLSWEIDVFGKITRQVRARKADVRVSRAEYEGVRLSVAAEIVADYIAMRMNQELLAVAEEHSESQDRVLHMVESRFEAGLASKLDVAQARTVYYSTRAQIPLLRAQIESYITALGELLACSPEELPAAVREPGKMVDFIQAIPADVPMDIVRQRPDVAQAEATVDAAAARLGVAKSSYLPSLSLQASVGTEAHRLGDLFTRPSLTYSVAPTLSWTVFDGLGRKFATESAREQMRADVAAYNQTVLSAAGEVRNAITSYNSATEYIGTLETVIEQCREARRLSVDLYMEGLTAFSNVVDAQINFLTYQSTAVQARGRAATALVTLRRAIGGSKIY